jgi:hypothetical protein
MNTQIVVTTAATLVVLLVVPACFILGESGLLEGETGGEPNEYWCTAAGQCLLAHPFYSPRVSQLIDDGRFHPHSLGTCEEPSQVWEAFAEPHNPWNAAPPLQAACCPEMGCKGDESHDLTFAICYPETNVWHLDGLVGAIAPLDAWGVPQCDDVAPLGFAYDYLYAVPCTSGVACEQFDTACGCTCDDAADCGVIDDQLELDYFGVDALTDAGWEGDCTGQPWVWDNFAYGSGGWIGSTCEFNQPQPGEIPQELRELIDDIACFGDTCDMPAQLIDDVLANSWTLVGSELALNDRGVEFVECMGLCAALGGSTGSTVVTIGNEYGDPTQPADLRAALDELRRGSTIVVTIDIRGTTHVHTFIAR